MFSSTVEYALRSVVHLANSGDRPQTAQQIAEEMQIPRGYIFKVLQSLGKAGLVNSQRGPNGGFTLARPKSEMTVLEVIDAVDPFKRITECPLKLEEHKHKLCPLHQRLDDAMKMAERVLGESTIQDMMDPVRTRDGRAESTVQLGIQRAKPRPEAAE